MLKLTVLDPADVAPHERLFLTGPLAELGHWSPSAHPLHRLNERDWEILIPLMPVGPTPFMLTKGTWRTVEADRLGQEHPPRLLTPQSNLEILVRVQGWGRNSIRYLENIESRYLSQARNLIVYLPPGYEHEPDQRYPVLYMHDGQNLFDRETAFFGNAWHCDEIAEVMIRTNKIRPMIIVGIANTRDRLQEYGPRRKRPFQEEDHVAQEYGEFIVREVKPLIDQQFRTRPDPPNTYIGGSSMGGLISLYLCRWHSAIFGGCAAISPSLWWENEHFLRTMKVRPQWIAGKKFWIDMGDREGRHEVEQRAHVDRTYLLADFLVTMSGIVSHHIYPEAHHTESAWSARFAEVLTFFFGK